MPKSRFDYHQLTLKTDEGFLIDSPIVARTGILTYLNQDGSIRRELRRPEEVFKADSLNSFRGKPITVDHPKGKVSSRDVAKHSVGTILVSGRQDGDFVRTDIVIHQPERIGDRRELSVGYDVDLDETPGEWNGERYDAEQTNIRVNHLSVVKKGRAGAKARLNLDSDEVIDIEKDEIVMPKIRLDNGIEYEASAEVIHALEVANGKVKETQIKLDAATLQVTNVTVEKDKLQARVDALPAEIEAATKKAAEGLKARSDLETTAGRFKVDCANKTDDEIKTAVIKSFNKDFDPAGKSADYIQASFDIAVSSRKDTAMQTQRNIVGKPITSKANTDSGEDIYASHRRSLGSNAQSEKV
jgi:hypothetical protein